MIADNVLRLFYSGGVIEGESRIGGKSKGNKIPRDVFNILLRKIHEYLHQILRPLNCIQFNMSLKLYSYN